MDRLDGEVHEYQAHDDGGERPLDQRKRKPRDDE
jgi:hypothetical protein